LDAYYARLDRLALRYILDPKEVYGEDFPRETFRELKEKEIKQFGVLGLICNRADSGSCRHLTKQVGRTNRGH
jgi:hypothetical protein